MATQVYPYLMRYPLSKLETRGLLSGVICKWNLAKEIQTGTRTDQSRETVEKLNRRAL